MREGYWVNFRTGREFEVHEHEEWLRSPGNASKLGVPQNVIALFGNFKPVKDRDKFLLFVMQHAPVMRMRGHGDFVSFEYASRERQEPMDAIWTWGKKNAGPFTSLNIVNFATHENSQMNFQRFEEIMDQGGAEAVLRVANRRVGVKVRIARELLELSKKLLLVLSIMLSACTRN